MTLLSEPTRTAIGSSVLTRAAFVEQGQPRVRPDELVRAKTLRRVAPSVFLPPSPPVEDRALAALEHAGEGAIITGWAACQIYRMRYVQDKGPIPVLVPHERRRVSTASITVLRTRRPPETLTLSTGVRLATPARALIDLARADNNLRTVRAILLSAVWRHVVTEQQLRRELDAGPRQGSALPRRVLDDCVAEPRPHRRPRSATRCSPRPDLGCACC